MDIAFSQPKWTRRHLIQINSCRRFLQAQTLADICTLSGTRLLCHVSSGSIDTSTTTLRISAFNQAEPKDSAWKTWRRFLSTISQRNGVLYSPLGHWIVDVTITRHWPQFLHNPQQAVIYSHIRQGTYYVHKMIGPNCCQIRSSLTIWQPFGYPTETKTVLDQLVAVGNYRQSPPGPPGNNALPYPSSRLPPWEHELISQVQLLQPIGILHFNLANGAVISCSDGSATEDHGTFGFIVSNLQGLRLAKCCGPAPGSYPNSFRSESYGVLALLRWLRLMLLRFGLRLPPPIKIRHYLDNRAVIQRITACVSVTRPVPNAQLLPEHDVINEIIHTWRQLQVHLAFEWVKGHQDSSQSFTSLPLESQLNCEADREASRVDRYDMNLHDTVTPLPSSPCQLTIQNRSVTNHVKRRVYDAVTIPMLRHHLCKTYDWEPPTYDSIDWKAFTHIIKKYQSQRTTLVKHLHDISPTGNIAHRNDHHLPATCPSCNCPSEDNRHVIVCPHPTRSEWRDATVQKLFHIGGPKSDPYLLDILRDGITRFHHDHDLPSPLAYPARYHCLLVCQGQIGWHQVYKGRWSSHWARLQDEYYQRNHHNQRLLPGAQWVISIGRLLIDQWLLIWKQRNDEKTMKPILSDRKLLLTSNPARAREGAGFVVD